jgi:hypothetical protein
MVRLFHPTLVRFLLLLCRPIQLFVGSPQSLDGAAVLPVTAVFASVLDVITGMLITEVGNNMSSSRGRKGR